jgi:hypothetical protein
MSAEEKTAARKLVNSRGEKLAEIFKARAYRKKLGKIDAFPRYIIFVWRCDIKHMMFELAS